MKSYEKPTAEIVNKTVDLLGNPQQYRYFFDRLNNPEWIKPLRERHFFSNPPELITEGDYIRFPEWPESRYLLRVVESAPKEVIDIALSLPDTNNSRVHEDFTQAACKIPAELAVKWAEKEKKWIEQQQHLYLNLSQYLGDLVQHLAEGSQVDTALKLAKALLYLQKDPQYEEKVKNELKNQDSEFFLPYYPTPEAKCDSWEYEQILKKNIPALVRASGIPVFEWLCKLLSTAIRLSRRHDEEQEEHLRDFSYIWRPAIEDHEQNHRHEIKDSLIEAVRNGAELLVKEGKVQLETVLTALEDRKKLPWPIFPRIALHVLRVIPDAPAEFVKSHLLDKNLFENPDVHHEYSLLSRDKFDALTSDEQQTVIDWILSDEEEARDSFIERFIENKGQPPTEEVAETYAHAWLRTKLALIKDYLPSELRQRYEEAVVKVGEAEHPEFITYSSGGWVGPTSPKSPAELGELSIPDLLKFLEQWQPSGELMADTRDGLARAIAAAVGENSEIYANACEQYAELHPTYVRGFIEGFHDATRENKPFSWLPVLQLCQSIVEQDRDFSPEILAQAVGDDREETNWGWTRKRIANLIEEGLKKDREVTIPYDQQQSVWHIIEILTHDSEPTEKNEQQMIQPFDAATMSINTVRGEAMHAVMYYVMWVRENIRKKEGDQELTHGFALMPEILPVLEERLDQGRERTLTIRSVYGRWYPYLVAWDENWAKDNKHKVFPPGAKAQKHWDVAWGTCIVYNRPYDNVFRVLRNEYRKALDRLGLISVELAGARPPDESLAQHLMTFYWRGLIQRTGNSLLNKFFHVASSELRGHAMGFIGRSLADTAGPVPPEIMDRFKKLWNWRLKLARSSDKPNEYESELTAFGKWFASGKLEPDWAMKQLLAVLRQIGRVEADEKMVEQLAALAGKFPKEVTKCFRLIVEGEPDGYKMWLWKEPGKKLLREVIRGTDEDAREAAKDLVHRLGAMGHMEFRELLLPPEE